MATHAAAALLLLTASLLAGTRCVHADADTIEELRDQLCRPVDSVPIVPPSRSWRVLDGTVMLTVFALFVAAVGFVLALLPPSLLFPHLRRRWGRPAGTAPRVLQIELPAEARASAKSDGRSAPSRPSSRPHTPKSRARSDSVRDVSSDAARDQASVITPEQSSTQPIKPYSASAFGSSSGSIELAGGPSITVLTSKTFSTPVQGTLTSLAPKPSLTNLAPAASAPEYSAHGVTRMKSETVESDVRGKQLGEVQIMKEQKNEIEDTMVEPIQSKPLNIQMVEEMEHVSINEDRIEEVGLEAKSSESQPSRASEVILKDVELAKESMEGKSLETESKEESTDAAQQEEEQAQPKEAEVLETDPKKQGEMENSVVMMNSLVEDKQQFLAEKFQDPLRMNLRVMPCGLLTDSRRPFIREHLAFHHPELFALTQGIQIEPEPKSSTAAADEDEEERMAEQRRLVLKALRSDTSVSTMSEATPPSPAHSGTQISLGRRSSMDLWSMLVPGSRGESTEGGDVLEQYESYVPDEDYGYEETQEPDESSVPGDTYVPDRDPGPEEANESQEPHELQLSVEPDGMFDGTYKPDEICAPDGFETGSPPQDHDDFTTLGVPGNFDEFGDNLDVGETIATEEEPYSHDSMLDTPCVTTLSSSDLVQHAEADLQGSKESLTFEQRLADLFGEERMSPDSDAMALAASLREELAQAARERWEQEREALAQRVRAAARGRRAALSKLGAAALEARILRRSNQKLQVERERTQQKLSAAQHAYRQSQRDKKHMAKQLLALQMELVEQRSRWDEAVVASALGSRGRLLAHALAAAPAAAAGAPLPPTTRSSTTVGAAPAPPPPPARPASAGAARPSPLFSALQSVAVSTSDIPCGDKGLPSVANLTHKISHALMQAGQFPAARHDVSTRTSPFYFMRSSETIPFTSASSSSRLLFEDPSVAGFADRGSPDSRKQFRSSPVDRARPEHWNMYHVPPSEPQVQWSGPELSDRTRMRGPLDVPFGPMYPGAKEAQSTREFDIDAMSCGGSCSRSYPQVPAPAAPEPSLPAAIVQSFISQLLAWTPLRPSASWDPRMRPRPSPERGEGAGAGAEASDGGDGEGERVGSVSARARRRRHPPSASASASASHSQSPAQSLARGGRRPRRGFHSKSGSSSPSVDAAAPRARRPQHAQSQRPPTGRAARARRRTPSPRRPVTPRVIERSRSRGRRSPTTGRWRDLRAGTPGGSPASASASGPAPPAAAGAAPAGGTRARRNSMQDMLFESSEVSEREGSARPRRAHESPGLEASRTPSWGSVATPPGRMRSSDRREQAAARRRASRRRRSRSHLSRPPSSSTPSASSPDRRAASDSVQNMLLAHVGSSSHLHKSPCKSKVTFQDKPEAITERGKSSRHPRRLAKSTGETQITETPEKQSEDSKMSEAAAVRPAQVPSLVELPPGAQAASAVALVCAPADAEGVVAAAEAATSGAKALSNLMPEIFAFPVAVMSPVALLLKSVMKESPPAEASQKEQAEAATKNANEKSAEESSKASNKRSEEATAERAKNMLEDSLKSLSGTRRETPKQTEKEVMKMLEEAKIVETLRDSSTSAHIRPEIIRASGDCVYDVPPSEGSRAERKRQIVDQFSEEEMRNIENFMRSKQREELSGDEDEVLSIDGEISGKTTPSYLCRGWDEDPTLSSEPATASAATISGARDASAVQTTSDLLDEPSDRMRPGGSPPMAVSSQSFHINDSSSLQSSDMSWDTPSPGDSSPPGIPWSPPQSTAFLESCKRKSLEELTLSEASDRKSPPTRLPLCGAITSPPNVSPSTTSFTESTESPSPLQRSSSSPSPVPSPVESITAFHLALDSKVSSLSEDAQPPNASADQPSPRSLACSGLVSPMQESLPNLSSPQSPLKHSTVSQQALVSSVSSSQESTTLMESPQMSSTATSVWQFPQQSGERTPFGNESKHTIRSLVDAHSGEQSSTTMSPTQSLTSTPSATQLSSAFETTQQGTILSSPQSLSMLETSKVSTLTESQSLQKSSSSLWQTSEISTLTSSLELSSKQPTDLESDHETEMLFTGPLPQPLPSSTLSSPTQLSPIEEAQPEISQSPSPTASASSYRESPCLQSQSLQTSSVWQSSTLSGITSPFDPSSKQSIETILATSPERPSSSTHASCSSPLETELLQQQLLQSPLCLTSVSSLTSSLTDSTLKLSTSSAVESLPQSRVISPVEPKLPSSPMLQSPTVSGADTPLGDYSMSTGLRSAFETIHISGVTSPSGEDSDQSPPTSRPVSGSLHCLSYSTLSTSGSPSPSQSSSLPESPTSNLPLHHSTEVGSTVDAFYEAMSTPLLQQQQISLDAASKQLTPAESISLTGSSTSSRAGSALPRPLPEAPTPPTSSLEGGSSSGSFLLTSLPATLRALDPAATLAPRPRRDPAADHRLSIVEEETTVPSVDSGGATGTISSGSSESIPCNLASSSDYDPIDMSYSGVSGVCGCSRSESSRWSNDTCTSEEEVWELPAEKRWVRSAPPTTRPSQAPPPPAPPPPPSPFAATPHTPGVATASESEGVGASASRRGSSESWASVASAASAASASWNSESGIVTNSEAFRKFLDLFEPSPARSEQDTPSGSVSASSCSGDEEEDEEDEQSALSAPVPATAAVAT